MTALGRLTGTEMRLFLREPMGVFFVLAFPTVLVAVLGGIPSFREANGAIGGSRLIDVYVSISITLSLAMVALQGVPGVLANYREKGVLRRMSTTPVHPAKLLAAQLVTNMLAVLVAVVLVMGFGRVAFGVPVPKQFLGYLVALVLSAAALFGLGLFIAALAPTGKVANAIGVILFFPVMFFAGLYAPREVMPAALQRIADFSPLGAGEHALHDAFAGAWPHPSQLLVLVGYLVVFGAAAARLFRWE